MDEDGIVMPVSENYTERVLVVTGDVSEQNHQDIFEFVNIINKSNFKLLQGDLLDFISIKQRAAFKQPVFLYRKQAREC